MMLSLDASINNYTVHSHWSVYIGCHADIVEQTLIIYADAFFTIFIA